MSFENLEHKTNQLELSYELLYLLAWIAQNEVPALRKIIKRAVKNSMLDTRMNPRNPEQAAVVQASIVDFFAVLEELLLDLNNEDAADQVLKHNLLPTLEKIDTSTCDQHTVRHSVEKAGQLMQHQPQQNPRDVLLKELLRSWRPHKKEIIN